MVSDAHKAANRRYDKTNTRQIVLKLNTNTDADILAWLDEQPNRQGAIKKLVREQIDRQPTKTQGLAGWYGWARCDGRDIDRRGGYATETEAIEHAKTVARNLRAEGKRCFELWEECDEHGTPVRLSRQH